MILSITLSLFLFLSLSFNYLTFYSNKKAIEIVDDMGIGYNLGNTYNCCYISENDNISNEQIKIWGTTLPTKKLINKLKKYGFKTIRFQVKYYNNLTYGNETIDIKWISEIKKIIKWIININMYCILSILNLEIKDKNKYFNFWREISNEFINTNDYLVLEYMNEITFENMTFYDNNQLFINTIRNSGGFNKKRLLIIPELNNALEIYMNDIVQKPIDPYNKYALSIHYYFPLEYSLYNLEITPMKWVYKGIYNYESIPIIKWGSENDYYEIINNFNILKESFTDKGIPIIFGEVGIITEYNNNINLFKEFLYVIFSLTYEYKGICPILWDNAEINSKIQRYYNKENYKWNSEYLEQYILNFKNGKLIKKSDYNVLTNKIIIFPINNNWYAEIRNKKMIKFEMNVKMFGKMEVDFRIGYSSINSEGYWIDYPVKKENGKKQYDGTVNFSIDFSQDDLNDYLYGLVYFGGEYYMINNVTITFEKPFNYFNDSLYKRDILKQIS